MLTRTQGYQRQRRRNWLGRAGRRPGLYPVGHYGLAPVPGRSAWHIVWAMGKILLVLLAVFAVFLIVSIVISALHFLFVVALVALVVVGALRLTGGMRRRARR